MRAVDPPTAVTVRRSDGVWPGWLSAWRHAETGWRAYVTYRRGPGVTHVHWVDANAVAPVSEAHHDTQPVADEGWTTPTPR
jgi:hypothetical protein